MNRLGVDLENWSAPANLAAQLLSPVARRALQITLGNSGVILLVGFPATRICKVAVGGVPFCLIFGKWLALAPRQFACFGVVQSGKACRLLRLGFSIITEQ